MNIHFRRVNTVSIVDADALTYVLVMMGWKELGQDSAKAIGARTILEKKGIFNSAMLAIFVERSE